MKIWCETCNGKGKYKDIDDFGFRFDEWCSNCNGKGYTVNEQLDKIVNNYKKVVEIATEYATMGIDGIQAIIQVADVVDAWVE